MDYGQTLPGIILHWAVVGGLVAECRHPPDVHHQGHQCDQQDQVLPVVIGQLTIGDHAASAILQLFWVDRSKVHRRGKTHLYIQNNYMCHPIFSSLGLLTTPLIKLRC